MLSPKVWHLPKWKAYELHTWYTAGARRPVSPTSDMTSKVKFAKSHDAYDVLARKSRMKSPRNTEIDRKVAQHGHWAIMFSSLKVTSQLKAELSTQRGSCETVQHTSPRSGKYHVRDAACIFLYKKVVRMYTGCYL